MDKAAPWIAFTAAMLALVANFVLSYLGRRESRRQHLLDRRREALFTALQVIDHVYANEPLGVTPVQVHAWNLQLSRDAINGILVDCSKPDQTLSTFNRALGLHNPAVEKPPGIDFSALDLFRREVARELGLSSSYRGQEHIVWINSLAGGKNRDS